MIIKKDNLKTKYNIANLKTNNKDNRMSINKDDKSSNSKSFTDFISLIGEDVYTGEFKIINNIIPFVVALFSPIVPLLFLFSREFVERIDTPKLLLLSLTTNVIIFSLTQISESATRGLKRNFIRNRIDFFDMILNNPINRRNEKAQNYTIGKLERLKNIQLELNENNIRKKSYIMASIINLSMGASVFVLKIFEWFDNKEYYISYVAIMLSMVYCVFQIGFFVYFILNIYQIIKNHYYKRKLKRYLIDYYI